ncbi:hypothetical protein SAMN02745883_00026 [Caminicella sporogenes DSM 14501]|uniref:Uncharacterized protein n=1 Tax=Caminicella sporogenes DSM 14501 TaxID=1121266 RepID=A0A1M6L0I3_9FIRM|nr:hypothetical protein [Caminicella sporogenes]WIF94761.1 hypothetical protein QNI18_10935 [Caminicella sporogenes]SHJ64687.1 hypothetical protein SAMN02745883_00026 [Caminicella sporogenes DSM 14501]
MSQFDFPKKDISILRKELQILSEQVDDISRLTKLSSKIDEMISTKMKENIKKTITH